MKKNIKFKRNKTALRAARVRARICGTAEVPRLSVKRSRKHIYAQLINDKKGHTLFSATDKDVNEKGKPVAIAHAVGIILGARAKAAGIKSCVFDRGAYRYHGRVAAIATGAREAGLIF